MELRNQQTIAAALQLVYDSLNDPKILRQCIPGCEAIDKTSHCSMDVTVTLRIGPIKTRFIGELEISDLTPPTCYTLNFAGKSDSAGDARGSATVQLASESSDITVITYNVNVQVTGRIAQVGNRLIDSAANALAKRFFMRFGELVEVES